MAGTPVSVKLGEDDKEYTIQRFKGLKAILAMASMTRIAREVPDIMADSVRAYQARNNVVITESMSRLPRWRSFTTEDFDAAERTTGKRQIELPTPMTSNEQVMYALPQLLEKARKEVTRLLALLLISHGELKIADKSDNVEDALDKYEDLLLYECELDQLVDLCFAAQDVLTEQLADRKDRLGKLMGALWGTWIKSTQQTAPQENPALPISPPSSTQEGTSSTSLMSTDGAPTSSTDLDEPTDGTGTQPSMASLGAS
jgi:hypothetical protein